MDARDLRDAAGHAGSADAVRACLARGDDPDPAPRGEDSPLCLAAMTPAIAKQLLVAAFRGHTDIVAWLARRGADRFAVGGDGKGTQQLAADIERESREIRKLWDGR